MRCRILAQVALRIWQGTRKVDQLTLELRMLKVQRDAASQISEQPLICLP